ncbi:MAG: acetylglutamate kinase [Terrimicrobiaceae bacterium]
MSSSHTADAESLIEALPYIQKFRGQTFVIKYGGAAMEDDQIVERFLRDVVFLEAVGINPVLVHGGGKAITARMRDAGQKAQFVNGLRATDAQAITIVEETLDREINPSIVENIIKFGGKARGFSGRNVFVAARLGPQRLENGEEIDIGFVGEATRIHSEEIRAAINKEVVPVISPIGAEESGTVLNINADIAAAALASSLKASKLIYVSDVPGIMRNPAEKDSLIPSVSSDQIDQLIKQKVIEGGMIPKVQSATAALKNGVEKIHLIGGQTHHCLLLEIFTDSGIGTEITA